MKWLAILFTLFILLVIVLADAGLLARYVGFVYQVPWGDKAGHFLLYGILALLLNLAIFRARHEDTSSGQRARVEPSQVLAERHHLADDEHTRHRDGIVTKHVRKLLQRSGLRLLIEQGPVAHDRRRFIG